MAAARPVLGPDQADTIADPSAPDPHILGQIQPAVSNPQVPFLSPASTESLLGRFQGDSPLTPMEDFTEAPFHQGPLLGALPSTPTDFASLMQTFSTMLSRGLAQNASHITSIIQADLQHLGARIEAVESKTDQAVAMTIQNTDRITELHDQLDIAYSKLDDLENRNRRYNFRLRGLPETFKDTDKVVREFISSLLPDAPEHRLELDRAHRALQPPRQDGLPRDIVVKPHFYKVKEEVMRKARETVNLTFQGFPIQVYSDLSPYTIQLRRSLKPLLQVLTQHSITYRWAFPFRLNFTHSNKSYGFSTFNDGERLLLQLGLISQTPGPPTDPKAPVSTKRPPPASPIQPLWQKKQAKRSKDGRPP